MRRDLAETMCTRERVATEGGVTQKTGPKHIEEMVGLRAYLARVEDELSMIPEADRREILLETRSHVVEQMRRAPSRPMRDVLAELGPPDAYARQFLREAGVPQLPPAHNLQLLGRIAAGRRTSLPLLFLVVCAYAVAVMALVLAATKVVAPDSIGVWIREIPHEPRYLVGITDRAPEGREVLGYWLIVPLLVIAASIHLGVSRLLKHALRSDQPLP